MSWWRKLLSPCKAEPSPMRLDDVRAARAAFVSASHQTTCAALDNIEVAHISAEKADTASARMKQVRENAAVLAAQMAVDAVRGPST